LNGTTYFIAEGNYNVQQLLNTLNNETLVGSNITVSFSDITAKITFTSSSLWTIAFNNDTINSASNVLGYTDDGVSYSLPHTPPNSINITYTTGVSIRVNNVATINQDTSDSSAGSTTILRVPINTSPNTILTHFNPTPFLTTLQNKTLTYLEVGLYDDDQRPLRIKDHPWFIVMRVDFVQTQDYYLNKTKINQMRETANQPSDTTPEFQEVGENPLTSHRNNLILEQYKSSGY
jgi:hypothetical protein